MTSRADVVGSDHRMEHYQSSALEQDVSRSVALHTLTNQLMEMEDGGERIFSLIGTTLGKKEGRCSRNPFHEQPVRGSCTAFLVAPQILLTAAHCLTDEPIASPFDLRPRCQNSAWVFDFKMGSSGKTDTRVLKENVFFCQEALRFHNGNSQTYSGEMLDYALILLDRPVAGREALKLSSRPMDSTNWIFGFGHIYGLPLKTLGQGSVGDSFENYFFTNLDASKGASGGPVLDGATGEVLGLLKGVLYPDGYREQAYDSAGQCQGEYWFPSGVYPTIALGVNRLKELVTNEIQGRPWLAPLMQEP